MLIKVEVPRRGSGWRSVSWSKCFAAESWTSASSTLIVEISGQ